MKATRRMSDEVMRELASSRQRSSGCGRQRGKLSSQLELMS
jgi:hypothetical protein